MEAPTKPLISVVITCHGKAEDLPVMLGCLQNQREYKLGPLYKNGQKTSETIKWVAGKKCEVPIEIIVTSDGVYEGAPLQDYVKLVENQQTFGVGHETRTPGIEAATGQYIVLTNADNYFVQGWVWAVFNAVVSNKYKGTGKPGIVYWNTVNNLWKWSIGGGSAIRWAAIDLSSVAIRADIAKKIKFPWKIYDGDWNYINACSKEAKALKLGLVKIDESLSVHN